MKWIIYFIMLGALVGCVHQTMLSSGAARHIQNITVYKGKTTENDIIAVLGQPESRREQMENGKITTRLSYGYFEDTGVYVNFTVCETNGACMTNLVITGFLVL